MAVNRTSLKPIGFRAKLTAEIARRRNAVTGDDGLEVSIVNIIVAISVSLIVIVGVVISVVFIVPMAQDAAIKSDLQSIQSAESVYYGKVAPPRYGLAAELVTEKVTLSAPTKKVIITVGTGANPQSYCAAGLSSTGTTFWLTSATSEPVSTLPTGTVDGTPAGATCPTAAVLAAAVSAGTAGIK